MTGRAFAAEWDAERYHRLSDPQVQWGLRVLDDLVPRPGESILDLGCGTGRLTLELCRRMGAGCVVGIDASAAMVARAAAAREARADGGASIRPRFVRADGTHLPFKRAFTAVFSTATFHWITDHERLFGAIAAVLIPGGRLVAQCGGGPNLRRLLDRTHALMDSARFASYFAGWADPWNFATIAETTERLRHAGFVDVQVSLEEAPVVLPDADTYADFLSCVCVRHHISRLPAPAMSEFVGALTDEASRDTAPFTLDYWRLNIAAVLPPSPS